MEVSSLHVFCLDNPIRFVDPFGLEPQAPRQIGVKDVYFSEYGMYLGEDDDPSPTIRIIAYKRWTDLKKNSYGKVNHGEAESKSVLFSYASVAGIPGAAPGRMQDFAILNVYKWVNEKFNITSQNLYIDALMGYNEYMRLVIFKYTDSKNNVAINLGGIGINPYAMARSEFCDNYYNIASILSHENKHKEDWQSDPQRMSAMSDSEIEISAYGYQINNPYWANTTPGFKQFVWQRYVEASAAYMETILNNL